MVPHIVNLLMRAGMAGVGVYAVLQWGSLRNLRKEAEKNAEGMEEKEKGRKARLERLQGKGPADNGDGAGE